jgi:hypothetical protein
VGRKGKVGDLGPGTSGNNGDERRDVKWQGCNKLKARRGKGSLR